jgi:SAM-dependent methyltransferase
MIWVMASDEHAGRIAARMAESWLSTLEVNAAFDRGWVEAAVDWLLPSASPGSVIDVGCGAGGAACAFAARLPPGSRVFAFDRDPRLLTMARRRAAAQGVGDRIRWSAGQVGALPVPDRSVDLVWASGVIHHVADQQAAVAELAALCRPGGRVALVEGGLPLRCLPHEIGLGRPGLEARLDEARARWFVDMRAELPGRPMPYGWPEALARAGLGGAQVRSFLAEVTPPLGAVGRAMVEQHLGSALSELGHRLDAGDRDTIARLLDPDDPAYVARRDDLVVTAVRTVHVATVRTA